MYSSIFTPVKFATHHVSTCVRHLATPAIRGEFRRTLEAGPSLQDFISGDTIPQGERVQLGRTNQYASSDLLLILLAYTPHYQ